MEQNIVPMIPAIQAAKTANSTRAGSQSQGGRRGGSYPVYDVSNYDNAPISFQIVRKILCVIENDQVPAGRLQLNLVSSWFKNGGRSITREGRNKAFEVVWPNGRVLKAVTK